MPEEEIETKLVIDASRLDSEGEVLEGEVYCVDLDEESTLYVPVVERILTIRSRSTTSCSRMKSAKRRVKSI